MNKFKGLNEIIKTVCILNWIQKLFNSFHKHIVKKHNDSVILCEYFIIHIF